MSFTREQERAITLSGNLIVSAAAGAGKTTVLTERVCRLVKEGMPIDRMLVLTFTRAAAGEMKARISKRLSEAAKEASGAQAAYFREQAAAVANASISTIDAFCAKVVFRHFFRVGLTPSCKTLDETEAAVLRAETRETALDALANDRPEDYRTLIVAFGSEQNLLETMEGFETFLSAQPEPTGWIDRNEAALDDPNALRAQLACATESDRAELRLHIDELQRETDKLSPEYGKVLSILYDLLSRARGALMQDTREGYAASLAGIVEMKDSLRFPNGTSDEEKAGVQDAKAAFKKLAKEQAARNAVPFETILETERQAAPVMKSFYALMRGYLDLFTQAKRAQNALDFADLEHMTIEILKDDEIAAEYRERFLTIIVDEYQDSNRVQETILNRIARPGGLFFVGDVKQSIYRFRMAEPSLFLEKCRDFHGENGTRIDLGHNFRSGKAVIDAVNAAFGTIMREAVAGIEYDARAMLIQGAPVPDGKAELHLFSRENDPEEEESLEDAEAEARFAARTILERMQRPVVDGKETRACRFGDFAVLLRNKNYARVWAQTLSEAGIPCYAQSSGGYFDAIEVKLLMSFLSVLDNRRQDIPLLASLRSPLFGFTDEELSELRAGAKKGALLDCLLAARETNAKVAAFFDTIERCTALSRRIPLSDLIERILDETHYREMIGVLIGGDQRLANLDALVRAAADCDAAGMSGVHGFLRFMENVKATQKLGAAATVTADVVRIMTVHASKGLEFPFVFYGGLGGTFNRKDETKPLIAEANLGAGLRYFDAFGVKHETLAHRNAAHAVSDASWAEELRVLYVGMTRAKQELYLLGSLSNAEKRMDEWKNPSLLSIRKSTSGLKLLMLSLNGRVSTALHKKSEFIAAGAQLSIGAIPRPTEAERADLSAQFGWTYPHPTVDTLPDKTSVTALERNETPEFAEPAFETGYNVLSEGSAVHRALERIPLFDEAKRGAFLDTLSGMTDFHADAIRTFAHSPLFARMTRSDRVEREWSFLCPMPANELLPETDSREPVLLQGVIDACFLENGAWVLLDYKTDRVKGDPDEYAKKHTRQVALYAAALERLSGIPVTERHIVLLGANAEVRV